ncbi:MAG: hypothetical protein KF760_20775 [Candidatus Eremiobacteraeota bacterium]|nr:hypothetical protein [Candidatus Eremiobacteraeota bacterium]MCW5871554.1 hypothetical protein [Candidatus Eremiobacteraeota bacterium]
MENSSTAFAELSQADRQRLLDKLAKLKALSACPTGNANETAMAAAAMARIMLEYEIEMAELDDAPGQDLMVLKEQVDQENSYRGFPLWQTSLLTCLAQVHHCIAYTRSEPEWWSTGVRHRNTRHLIGTSKDIENVRQLFRFCVFEIERLSRSWDGAVTQKRRNDFKVGAGRGVSDQVTRERDRIVQEQKQRNLPSRALQLFDRKEQASSDFARKLGLGYRTCSSSRGVYADAYGAGYQAGSQLDLSPSAPRKALSAGR